MKLGASLKRPRLPAIGQGSLVGRLIWLASAWSLLVLAITCVAMVAIFYAGVISRFDQGLREVADGLFAGAVVDETGAVAAPPFTDPRSLRAYSGRYWEIAELRGGRLHALERSRSLWDGELSGPDDMSRLTLGASVKYDTRGPLKEPLRAVALVRALPGRQGPVIFLAAEDRSPIDRDVRRFGIEAALLLVLLGAGLVLMVVIQVRVGLKPLFDLRREVIAVRQGRSERVQKDYPAELAPLANELNALVAHNQEVVERQRTHVGNLAHALKTPLSVMLASAWRVTTSDSAPCSLAASASITDSGVFSACASRSTVICAAPARPPAPRDRATAPWSRRRWRSWPAPWSGSSSAAG